MTANGTSGASTASRWKDSTAAASILRAQEERAGIFRVPIPQHSNWFLPEVMLVIGKADRQQQSGTQLRQTLVQLLGHKIEPTKPKKKMQGVLAKVDQSFRTSAPIVNKTYFG